MSEVYSNVFFLYSNIKYTNNVQFDVVRNESDVQL